MAVLENASELAPSPSMPNLLAVPCNTSIIEMLRRPRESAQYTSKAFTELCRRNRITQSMSRSGSCLDNAVAESFFATLKTELVYRIVLATRAVARRELLAWFDRYNRVRRHSHCGFRAPITYEKMRLSQDLAA